MSTVKISWSSPWYIRCNIGSWSAFSSFTGKYSSIRRIPLRPMFWVISTAFVLHGVIISRRGPMNHPFRLSSFSTVASLYSQHSFLTSSAFSSWLHSVAITLFVGVLKNRIIALVCYNEYSMRFKSGTKVEKILGITKKNKSYHRICLSLRLKLKNSFCLCGYNYCLCYWQLLSERV